MLIDIPQDKRFIASYFKEEDWQAYLRESCELTAFKLVLGKNRLSDEFKAAYGMVVEDKNVDLQRRLAMFLAMVGEPDQFTMSSLCCVLRNPDLIDAGLKALTPEEQIRLLSQGLMLQAIERTQDKYFPLESAFLDVMKAVKPQIRINAIHGLTSSNFIEIENIGERITHLIAALPKKQQYEALTLVTGESELPGLHRMLDYSEGFEYFLNLMTPEQRLNALLQTNVLKIKLIIYCIENYDLMRLVFQYLSRQQCVVLFNERHISGGSIFSFLLEHHHAVNLMIAHHTPDEIIQFCMQTQPILNRNSVIISYVLRHLDKDKVMLSIETILRALPYRDRLRLLEQRDSTGINMMEAVPRGKQNSYDYKVMIQNLTSPKHELRRLVVKYEAILKRLNLLKIKIRDDVELLVVSDYIELEAIMKYFKANSKKTFDEMKNHFQSLLAERYLNSLGEFLPFTHFPSSLVNQFCFESILVLSNPNNLAELVSEFMGRCGQPLNLWLIEVPEVFPENLTYKEKIAFFRHSEPSIRLTQNLTSLTHLPPTLSALSTLAFGHNSVINLNDINRFSLKRHIKLYQLLNNKLPHVAQTIYQHNSHWRSLSEDINTILKSGLTPLKAIEALIQGLKQGGEAHTGVAQESGMVANTAIVKFLMYLEGLPAELKLSLEALEDSYHDELFVKLIKELHECPCVEQLSERLNDLIEINSNEPCMHENPGFTDDFIADVDKKCRVGIDVEKNEIVVNAPIPYWIAKGIVARMNLCDLANKIYKINTIPNSFMDPFFRYIELHDAEAFFIKLTQALNDDFFSKEKKVVLLAALANHSMRVNFQPYMNNLLDHYDVLMNGPHRELEQFKSLVNTGVLEQLRVLLGNHEESEIDHGSEHAISFIM